MTTHETPEMIASRRQVSALTVLGGRFDPQQYPFQYLAVAHERRNLVERMSMVLAAAELLQQRGWDLVNVTEAGPNLTSLAILRRR